VSAHISHLPGNCFLIECGGRKSAAPLSSRPHANDWQKRTRGARNQFQSLLLHAARSLRLGSGSSGGSSRCGARRREKPAQTGGAGVDARRRPRAPKFTEIKEAEIVNK
jgi:hypothetical protein